MLVKNYSRKAAILYIVAETAHAKPKPPPVPVSCTISDSTCFEDKTSAEYLSYFDISNLSLITPPAWTTTVSAKTFGNFASHTQKGPLIPVQNPIPS